MSTFASLFEQNPDIATAAFNNIEAGLNKALPGKGHIHPRYQEAKEVGLAIVVDHTDRSSYNPINHPHLRPAFRADNQTTRPNAWGPIDPEFLEGQMTLFGKFAFFALAKTENMRATGGNSSYDPDRTVITPGRVGFAGGRRLLDTFVTPSGLWEVHDHLVAGTFIEEVSEVAAEERAPRTGDDFAEYFEEEFARVKELQNGVAAADLTHKDVGQLLPLIDDLPYQVS